MYDQYIQQLADNSNCRVEHLIYIPLEAAKLSIDEPSKAMEEFLDMLNINTKEEIDTAKYLFKYENTPFKDMQYISNLLIAQEETGYALTDWLWGNNIEGYLAMLNMDVYDHITFKPDGSWLSARPTNVSQNCWVYGADMPELKKMICDVSESFFNDQVDQARIKQGVVK